MKHKKELNSSYSGWLKESRLKGEVEGLVAPGWVRCDWVWNLLVEQQEGQGEVQEGYPAAAHHHWKH